MDGVGKGFQFRRPEPIDLALNKGIIESETGGSPVLVDLVHIPSDLFWHHLKTNGNTNYVRCCERMAEVSVYVCLWVRGKICLLFCSSSLRGREKAGRCNAEY